jgi:hypothetical protein
MFSLLRQRNYKNSYRYINAEIILSVVFRLSLLIHLLTCVYLYVGFFNEETWIHHYIEEWHNLGNYDNDFSDRLDPQ